MQKLSPNFLAELFKLMFLDINIIRMVNGHLTYQHIPKEWVGYKFLFKEAVEQFNKRESVPSLGVAAQKFANNKEVQETIEQIKAANLADKELIIDQLETFIKKTEFEILSKKVHDLYEEGKEEEAIQVNAEESKEILKISLRKTGGNFVRIFADFKERMRARREEQNTTKTQKKILFGIDKLDELTYGGADPGDTVLWIMRSGIGKSTVLRWHGYSAALEGEPVLHIQLEGGIDACTDKYDQIWTNQSFIDIKKGHIKPEDEEKILKACKEMQFFGQDIDVYGFAKFGEASMTDIRNLIIDYINIYERAPRLIILDSLDLAKTGTNNKIDNDPEYLKHKLQRNAQLLKDIAVEFNCVVITAAQASDVPIEVWNNEDRVIDRSNTEGDRTLVKPFSFVFTGNMTMQEKKEKRMRIFIDKFRDYKDSQSVFTIASDYDHGKFYDRSRTMELYYSLTSKVELPEKKEKGTSRKVKAKTI
jgi:replicative DNA helicase